MKNRKGLTATEILVIIVIIGILIALLLPAVNQARRQEEIRKLMSDGTEVQVIKINSQEKPKQIWVKITVQNEEFQKLIDIEEDSESLEVGDIISVRIPKHQVKVLKRLQSKE